MRDTVFKLILLFDKRIGKKNMQKLNDMEIKHI